jgi:hypothetical protein
MALPAAAQLDTTRRAVIVRAGPDNLFPQVRAVAERIHRARLRLHCQSPLV